jgi:hypothetical protein
MVPKTLRHAVWRTYRPGQEIDKDPSAAYLESAAAAIEAVAVQEQITLKSTSRGGTLL